MSTLYDRSPEGSLTDDQIAAAEDQIIQQVAKAWPKPPTPVELEHAQEWAEADGELLDTVIRVATNSPALPQRDRLEAKVILAAGCIARDAWLAVTAAVWLGHLIPAIVISKNRQLNRNVVLLTPDRLESLRIEGSERLVRTSSEWSEQ